MSAPSGRAVEPEGAAERFRPVLEPEQSAAVQVGAARTVVGDVKMSLSSRSSTHTSADEAAACLAVLVRALGLPRPLTCDLCGARAPHDAT